MMEELIQLTWEELLEFGASQAQYEIDELVRAAREHINRSVGQHIRYSRERFNALP